MPIGVIIILIALAKNWTNRQIAMPVLGLGERFEVMGKRRFPT
ncbi:MAG: hypothetical protein ACXV2C_08775 [Candidatus Bathyarchaeia archaeon]